MDRSSTHKYLSLVLFLVAGLFVAGRIVGDTLTVNNWSFTHWNHLSAGYLAAWWIGGLLLIVLLGRFLPAIGAFFESRRNILIAGPVLLVCCWLLQYDSFLYAGGNVEVARIAQAEDVVRPWYAWGSTLLARLLHLFWALFALRESVTGVLAWRTLAYAAAALSLVGSYKTASRLTDDPTRRLGLFIILFFGPQFILYPGFIGAAPMVAAAVIWIGYWIVCLSQGFSLARLGMLWLVTAAAVIYHAAALYVIPAVIAVSLGASQRPNSRGSALPPAIGAVALAALVAALYLHAGGDLHLRSAILLLDGKPPHGDYGLFSPRHLSDMAQTAFLLFPLGLAVLFLLIRRLRWLLSHPLPAAALLLCVGGAAALFVVDPAQSIVLDLPRLAIYLTPGAFLLAVLLGDRPVEINISPALVGVIGALSLVLPLSFFPAYTDIYTAENYATPYLDRHSAYYRTAAVAFRDAYFYRKDMNEANDWDQSYQRRSPDYLTFSGIEDFAEGGRIDIAVPSLNKLIARNPYWPEPRALFGRLMMEQGRYDLARPALDTALALDPYNPVHYINLYSLLRDQDRFAEALAVARDAAGRFPHNMDIKVDIMILNYRAGRRDAAADLADQILAADSSQAYPYVIKGFLAESAGDLPAAQRLFEKFASLAPNAPEAAQIRKRANDIYLKLQGRSE